jgi:hypothetical protein
VAADGYGDFQTPPALAEAVVAAVRRAYPGRSWPRVLEPTCGTGAFLDVAGVLAPRQVLGIEISPGYAESARRFGEVLVADVFAVDLGRTLPWRVGGDLLVLGNPPWVTNAGLTRLNSDNRPHRHNVHGLRGIEARTGASNFDLAECVWLKLITELAPEHPTIALLCKTRVARHVLTWCGRQGVPVRRAELRLLDSRRWFGAAVDAGLFVLELGDGPTELTCQVYPDLAADEPVRAMGVVGDRLVGDVVAYTRVGEADGVCPLEWRQGIKHDAAGVMEVRPDADVEPDHLFPLLKSSDLHHGRRPGGRLMVVPQRTLGTDTGALATTAPRLWRYLLAHADALDGRRSAIYRDRPRFSVFGVGPYSFAPYKVAVSGLHAEPRFRAVGPSGARPVVFDDTCYFLPFADAGECAATAAVLQSTPTRDLLAALTFAGSKRPITKAVLRRLDLAALTRLADGAELAHLTAVNHADLL